MHSLCSIVRDHNRIVIVDNIVRLYISFVLRLENQARINTKGDHDTHSCIHWVFFFFFTYMPQIYPLNCIYSFFVFHSGDVLESVRFYFYLWLSEFSPGKSGKSGNMKMDHNEKLAAVLAFPRYFCVVVKEFPSLPIW